MSEFKLCYVDLPWCYFTTRELSEQWGDDWNDAPYEHNAGTPYEWRDDGTAKFEIKKVAIYSSLEAPGDRFSNSPYSVEMINNYAVPWLKSPDYERTTVEIMAGTAFDDFVSLVKLSGGSVYQEIA